MSKYFQFILVIVYAFLTISAIFLVMAIFWGFHTPVRGFLFFPVIIGWMLICLFSAYFFTDIWLLFQEVRRPIREEEEKLSRCLQMLRERPCDQANYRLRIEEEMSINAFAVGHHTIVVSRGLLLALPEKELTAVLAHELGHLATRDCIASMAYVCATFVPRKVGFVLKKGLQLLSHLVLIGIAQGILGLAVVCFLLFYFHVFHYVIGVIAFILLITGLEAIFGFLWLLNSRYTEYRQDAFAHRMGFGRELKNVLLKINNTKPQKVNFFYTLRSTHPIIYNRVRRLEKLEESEPAA
jgi:Zn-dependent protease with chaperone function